MSLWPPRLTSFIFPFPTKGPGFRFCPGPSLFFRQRCSYAEMPGSRLSGRTGENRAYLFCSLAGSSFGCQVAGGETHSRRHGVEGAPLYSDHAGMNVDRIPAISVWQPWASLIAAGLKPFEVRGWCPPKKFMHRPIAIHAAMKSETKSVIRGLLDVYQNTAAMPVIEAALRNELPHGAVLCTVIIKSVMPSDAVVDPLTSKRFPAGGFAWQLDIVHYFSRPVDARGMQGFWWWEYNPATRRAEQGALL